MKEKVGRRWGTRDRNNDSGDEKRIGKRRKENIEIDRDRQK